MPCAHPALLLTVCALLPALTVGAGMVCVDTTGAHSGHSGYSVHEPQRYSRESSSLERRRLHRWTTASLQVSLLLRLRKLALEGIRELSIPVQFCPRTKIDCPFEKWCPRRERTEERATADRLLSVARAAVSRSCCACCAHVIRLHPRHVLSALSTSVHPPTLSTNPPLACHSRCLFCAARIADSDPALRPLPGELSEFCCGAVA